MKAQKPLTPNREFSVLLSAGGKESTGSASAYFWTDSERKNRAWRGMGLMWGLAVFSVFLPLAHFLLVPGFLIAGPIVFFWFKKQSGRITGLLATCPYCTEPLSCGESSMDWPLRMVCGSCSEPVRIDLRS